VKGQTEAEGALMQIASQWKDRYDQIQQSTLLPANN
jgi:hypothetical protein